MNYNSENEFKNELALRNNYTLDEIKKIKIELFWNELIYSKFKRQLRIDQDNKEKIPNTKNKKQNEYFLSEIVFSKKR